MTLGASLHNVLSRVKALPQTYPAIDIAYSPTDPIQEPVTLQLPSNGLRLRFDGPDQRLRLIEVLDFSKISLVYKNQEVLKGGKPQERAVSHQGPSFGHIYHRLFGPSYPGEYQKPTNQSPYGTYVLSYPGVAFSFPLQHSAWSDQCDFVALLSSSAALPATSMAIFEGSSWSDARERLFTQQPKYPRSPALAGKNKESVPDEVEEFNILGAGRLEVIRRSSPPSYITLAETTPQDLVAEFGPPDAIYRKHDRRITIHRAAGGGEDHIHMSPPLGRGIDVTDTDQSSNNSGTEDSDEELSQPHNLDPSSLPTECFFNYFHHGFDAFVSYPTTPGPAFPGSDIQDPSPPSPSSQLVVTKIILHGNVPGSYPFNRHRRSRWKIKLDSLGEVVSSETRYEEVSDRLREVWKGAYGNPAEERALQRPMVLNRGWGDSPESSVEFLGGWEESTGKGQRLGQDSHDGGLGNTELFGFPGLLFEVMKNGAVSCLTRLTCSSGSMPELSRALTRSWSSTLKLPKSTFPARVTSADQTKYLRRCTDELYAWQRRERPAEKPFVLHDGPPYANGELHVGHALNKILKDIICRVQLGLGKRVRYVPGWDCHGLPIELKALEAQKGSKDAGGSISAAVIRKEARALARRTVKEQMKGFRGFAVMGDWENHWKTMDKEFEKRQLGVFREMVDKGLIYRRFKPVYWSPSTGTALAEAELEYKDDHVSTAALVKFPLVTIPSHLAQNPLLQVKDLTAVIWTTTPWTLPANAVIAVHPELEYTIVQSDTHGHLLVAQSRLQYLENILKEDLSVIIPSILGSELADRTTYRPLFKGADAEPQPIIAADFVTADSGSGLVHCAPGHGMDDYDACLSRGIPAFAPVDDHGRFTDQAMPSDPTRLSGKSVLDEGNVAALEYIESQGYLLSKHRYEHKYPYDWRSKRPIIIRATEQWFADVADIRDSAVKALEDVHFVPPSGRQRLENFVKNRSEWCISRQRAWGVPIPALYHRSTGEAVLTKDTVSHIMAVIDERGVDAWWTDDANDPAWIPPFLQEASGPGYRRGTDTMDVWFDSGTSWAEIETPYPNGYPADVYLEGTDQHRGWFQSGLLTFTAHQLATGQTAPRAPFRHLITHGFFLDEQGRKMSKSIGNVIHPQAIMDGTLLPPLKPRKGKKKQPESQGPVYDALGPDALRMWVASSDYTRDVAIGKQVLQTVNTSLHKYRVTFKLLLGALSDFRFEDRVPYEQLQQADRIALKHLSEMTLACQKACEHFEFYKAVNALNRWANLEFSAFYMEAIKDRLYTYGENSLSRRAAQTTLFHIYHHLQEALAPITPMLVEETWEHTPAAIKSHCEHPLKRIISVPPSEWQNNSLEADYQDLIAVHSVIKNVQEIARGKKELGSSLQSFVHIVLPQGVNDTVFQRTQTELPDIFVVSSVTLGNPGEPIPATIADAQWQYNEDFELPSGQKGTVYVYTPQADKCPRCWRYVVLESQAAEEAVCDRCEDVVSELDVAKAAKEAETP
ncbi:tRNA synthetases class I-domain-containing protein [Aspergillus alliaceus]|uniref:tRNA synthetases class I-domain-containing protein n=1 Tax=Petromyces alliaceus TaxID=209559 RepID=UPI0012A712D4|nr:tRNA synthetases class I-domain-containing protein [Aspergillus alliaceus]KAB8236480.1 tRNA synthetases class I-domain-containing protein [Aspergillus alliaceus]